MIFKTLNSTYEVDRTHRQIRRIEGVNDPTPRQGTDGEWREYHALTMLLNGSYLIAWDAHGRCTITSRVVES